MVLSDEYGDDYDCIYDDLLAVADDIQQAKFQVMTYHTGNYSSKSSGYLSKASAQVQTVRAKLLTEQGEIFEGAVVVVGGLKNATHLNGLKGVAARRDGERWVVMLEIDGKREEKAIKPANLSFPEDGSSPAELSEVLAALQAV